MRRRTLHRFETLESRLAMAGLFTFTDVDGDIVDVRTSRGTDLQLRNALTLAPVPGGEQLQVIALFDPVFARTNLSITVRPSPGVFVGNGQVDVGMILTNLDLGTVTVGGDLGKINAGDLNPATPAITTLTVTSLGQRVTGTGASDTNSFINGAIRSVRVSNDVVSARLDATGRLFDVRIGGSIFGGTSADGIVAASIGRLDIGGDLIGGSVPLSGNVYTAVGGVDRLTIRGSLIGSLADDSAVLRIAGRLGQAQIGGSVSGGGGARSGSVLVGAAGITRLVVQGNITGGGGENSGLVRSLGSIGSLTVGGLLNGGSVGGSGGIGATGNIGTLTVGGIQGGWGISSGVVYSGGRIGTLRTGRILAGDGIVSGMVTARELGNVTVAGDISGSLLQQALITARGSARGRAINSLTVRGNLLRTTIAAGYSFFTPENGSARIGSVTVGGSMAASSVVAGVENLATPLVFGNSAESIIPGGRGSRIDSLVIRGTVGGSFVPGQTFGVHASAIGRVQVGAATYRATAAGVSPSGDNLMIRLV